MIDIAGELSARRGDRFEDYTQAIQNLAKDERFPPDLASDLEPIPGLRSVLVHDYVGLDLDRVIDAMNSLEPVESFFASVHQIISDSQSSQL